MQPSIRNPAVQEVVRSVLYLYPLHSYLDHQNHLAAIANDSDPKEVRFAREISDTDALTTDLSPIS